MPAASTAHQLLVAAPTLGDPNFAHAVVFVLEHSSSGAVGVVLNRPTDTRVIDVLPRRSGPVSAPAVVFLGGPVEMNNSVIGLGTVAAGSVDHTPDGWVPIVGSLGAVDLDVLAPSRLTGARVFAGYAGWGPEQLDAEVEAGDWYVMGTGPDDVLTHDPGGLWRAVLRRQGPAMAMRANRPLDPSDN